MALEGWTVRPMTRNGVKAFIEKHHYSHSINGCKSEYHYGLFDPQGWLRGAMFFGRMAMAGQWRPYGKSEWEVIELRRLVCVDDTPRNAESFFIGHALRQLKKIWGGKVVVSYSDLEYGHVGTIYKASNFKFVGYVSGHNVIVWGDKRYHDKTIRTYYNGQLKPYAQRVKDALESGEAYYKKTKGKHCYVYTLRK